MQRDRLPRNALPGQAQHVLKALKTRCVDKIDKVREVAIGRVDGYKRPNLRGTGQTAKGMAIRKDNEGLTGPKAADNEVRKQPLLCHSPTSSRPRRTGKSSRKATNCRRKPGIKVTPAFMEI